MDLQKLRTIIHEDYERIDQPPDLKLHPQTRDKKNYVFFYEEQGKRFRREFYVDERISDILSIAQGDCLDIGCREGSFTISLARKGYQSFGIDISFSYLEQARSFLNKEPQDIQNRVRYLQAWAEYLPFKDGQFQTVLLGEILEHVINPRRVLEEALRVLSSGGIIYISVPAFIDYFIKNNPEHVRIFSEKVLMGLLNESKDLLNFGTIRWYSKTPLVGNFRLSIRKREDFCGK